MKTSVITKVIGVLLTSCLFSRLHRLDKYSPGASSSFNTKTAMITKMMH